MSASSKATLFLVATPIGNLNELSKRALDTLREADVVACEDTRNTLKLFSHFDIHSRMISYHNFNEEASTKGIVDLLKEGKNVALVSDAGYPLISDPGYELVNRVIEEGFDIVTVSGPNAALNALVASGLDTAHYLYYGFLSSKQSQARKELESLRDLPYTLIFYEAPHRILKTLQTAYEVLGDRKAVIARELTKLHEEYIRGRLGDLQKLEEVKGEIVLLIEGKKEEETVIDPEELKKEVDELIEKGLRTKEAIAKTALRHQVSKNELYDYYHKK